MESKGGGGAEGAEQRKAGGERAGGRRGEETGCRLESQDLRLFWLDGSQMLLPSLQFVRRGEYTGAQLVARDRWVSGCAEMGLLWNRGEMGGEGHLPLRRRASVCSSVPTCRG